MQVPMFQAKSRYRGDRRLPVSIRPPQFPANIGHCKGGRAAELVPMEFLPEWETRQNIPDKLPFQMTCHCPKSSPSAKEAHVQQGIYGPHILQHAAPYSHNRYHINIPSG